MRRNLPRALDLCERLPQPPAPPVGEVRPQPSSHGHVVYDLGDERWRVREADGAVVAYLHYEMRDGEHLKSTRRPGCVALHAAWFAEAPHAP